jgi:hypothetical protein
VQFSSRLLLAAVLLPLGVTAQAVRKPAAKSAVKPTAKPTAKPTLAASPAAKPTPAPAAQPIPVASAQPAASAPATIPARTRQTATSGTEPFVIGTNALNLGIGLGNRYGYGAGSSVAPAISLSYERGVVALGPGVLGVGAYVGYQGAHYDLGSGDKWKYSDVLVLVRGAFHYPVAPQFDAYGGLGLGVRHAGVSFEGGGLAGLGTASATDVTAGLFVGGRYFFSPRVGAFAEVGYDQTFLKLGVAAKF